MAELQVARVGLTGHRRGSAIVPAITIITAYTRFSLMLDETPPTIESGFANVEEVDRLDRAPITNWKAPTSLRMKVPVLLDGLARDLDQQRLVDRVLALAMTSVAPPTFTATGPLPLPNRRWWLANVDWGDASRNAAGVLVRQALVLSLLEPVTPDVLPQAVAPPPSKKGAGGGAPTTYTTKKGDTLRSIAAKVLHNITAAQALGKLNGIRDTTKPLHAGIVLRLPKQPAITTGFDSG